MSQLHLELDAVIDCRNVAWLDQMLDGVDYKAGQQLAAEAIERRAEGVLVPSITRLGDNLVVFPNQLRSGSSLRVVGFRDELRLYPNR